MSSVNCVKVLVSRVACAFRFAKSVCVSVDKEANDDEDCTFAVTCRGGRAVLSHSVGSNDGLRKAASEGSER